MATFKYSLHDIAPDVEWEELMYHGSVKVVGGIAEVADDDDLTIDSLLRRGFERVEAEAAPAPKKAASTKKSAEPDDADAK